MIVSNECSNETQVYLLARIYASTNITVALNLHSQHYGSEHQISVPIASASSDFSGEFAHIHRLAISLAACMNKVWVYMEVQTKF